METELYHYGVKGMHWGVRRYQHKDGSLTAAGKKRYYDTPELNRQKAEMKAAKSQMKASREAYNRVANLSSLHPERAKRALEKSRFDDLAYRRAKLKYDTNREVARIQDKGIEIKNKSKHRLKLEEQFKKLGMDDVQAEAAANKRIRSERIMVACAAVPFAVAATYVASKAIKDRADRIIKSGTSLQRIEMKDTDGKLHHVFFASNNRHDNTRYKYMLGRERQVYNGQAYLMELMTRRDVKVASQYNARKAFRELLDSDDDFRKSVEKHIGRIGDMGEKKAYELFNAELGGILRNKDPAQAFYKKLKSAGYGAVQDINDMKYSGYAAKNPLIFFDNSDDKISVKRQHRILDTDEFVKRAIDERTRARMETKTQKLLKKLEFRSLAGLTIAGVGLTNAATTEYRKDPSIEYKNQGGTSKWH